MANPLADKHGHVPLQKLNHRHQQLVNWLLLNPDKPLFHAAKELNYSPDHVSAVVRSDAFQAVYKERLHELGDYVAVATVDKLQAATDVALERVTERLFEGNFTEEFLSKSITTLLKAGGFTAVEGNTAVQRHMHLHAAVDPQVLLEARKRTAEVFNGKSPQKLESQPAEGVQAGEGESEELEANSPAALFYSEEG